MRPSTSFPRRLWFDGSGRCKIWLCILAALILVVGAALTRVSRPGKPAGRPVPPNQAPVSATLTVLDLNTLHGYPHFSHLPQRLSLLREQLEALQPDLVFLQEVPWRPGLGYAAEKLAANRYAWLYANANGSRFIHFEEGEAILSRYPLTGGEVHELHPQARPFEHRIVLHTVVHLPAGDLHLFVTHLTDKEAFLNSAQAADLYRYVDATAGSQPSLIAGDFNAHPDEPTIRRLHGWQDLFAQVHPRSPGYTCCADDITAPVATPYKRIDYIFYRPGAQGPDLRVQDIRVVFDHPFATPEGPLWLSDHFGLLARFDISPR